MSEVTENSEVKSTDAEVEEATYLVERVHGAERETEGVRGQAGQDRARRGMAIPRASENTDMEVGIMECSNSREHGKRTKGGTRVMGSSKDQSTHSKGDVGERGEPTGGEHGTERVGTLRYATCGSREPAGDRRNRERIRMVNKADKGRTTGSKMAFGRAERVGRCGHRTWRIGWNRRFGKNRWVWWIGWRPCFENMRLVWWTGKRRWSEWSGWFCSKWRTKTGMPMTGAERETAGRDG
jgi:hypothetical protein